MPGRDEALERARLAQLRQDLNVDRNDHTLFRGLADEGFRGPLSASDFFQRSTLPPEERERAEQGLSASLAGLVAVPVAAGVAAGVASLPDVTAGLQDEERQRVLQRSFPELDSSMYPSGTSLRDQAGVPEFSSTRQRSVPTALRYGRDLGLQSYDRPDFLANEAGAIAMSAGRDPTKPSADDLWAANIKWDEAVKSNPLRTVDWDKSARELGRKIPDRLTTIQNVPQFGPDLGGFARQWPGPEDGNRVAYTVVPDVNSSRFSQRLLPALVDQVYTKDAKPKNLAPTKEWFQPGGAGTALPPPPPAVNLVGPGATLPPPPAVVNVGSGRGYEFAASRSEVLDRGATRPVPRTRMADLDSADRIALLERMAPGQVFGRNQSGYIWGTLTDMPRYGYGGDGVSTNPEVVVSEVRTPPELETKYLYTGDTHDPAVRYNQSPDARAVGPAWGATELPTATPLGSRRKRDVQGDISFRTDLIERRGGLSLADAQAVQSRLGLPVAFGREGLPAAQALERAVESIRTAEQLSSHSEVIEKYARPLPRIGSTTSPRQPATGRIGEMPLDTRLGVTSGLKRAFDVSGALRESGYEPSKGGLRQANTDIAEAASGRTKGLQRVAGLAPAAGALLGLADPQAAELVGAALRERGDVRTGLVRDAARVYGQNLVVGAAQGGIVSAALAAAPRLGLGGLATSAVAGLGVAGPALAGAAVLQTADSYLKGATGEGLSAHTRRAQQQVQPALRNPVNAVFPTPRAVIARTPSGVAQLRPHTPVNPFIQEAKNRAALFRKNFNPLRGDLGVTELLFGRGR